MKVTNSAFILYPPHALKRLKSRSFWINMDVICDSGKISWLWPKSHLERIDKSVLRLQNTRRLVQTEQTAGENETAAALRRRRLLRQRTDSGHSRAQLWATTRDPWNYRLVYIQQAAWRRRWLRLDVLGSRHACIRVQRGDSWLMPPSPWLLNQSALFSRVNELATSVGRRHTLLRSARRECRRCPGLSVHWRANKKPSKGKVVALQKCYSWYNSGVVKFGQKSGATDDWHRPL